MHTCRHVYPITGRTVRNCDSQSAMCISNSSNTLNKSLNVVFMSDVYDCYFVFCVLYVNCKEEVCIMFPFATRKGGVMCTSTHQRLQTGMD